MSFLILQNKSTYNQQFSLGMQNSQSMVLVPSAFETTTF